MRAGCRFQLCCFLSLYDFCCSLWAFAVLVGLVESSCSAGWLVWVLHLVPYHYTPPAAHPLPSRVCVYSITYHIYTLYMIVVCSSNSPASFMSVIAALAFTGLEPPARDRKDSCSVRFASLVCCLLVWPHSRNPRGYWASQEPIWLPHGRTMRELQ